MYEIRKDGAVLALTEKPTYIYRHEEGFYALCDEAQAQGIAVNGTPYSLHGRPAIEGLRNRHFGGDRRRLHPAADGADQQHRLRDAGGGGSIDEVTAGEHAEVFAPWAADVAYTAGQLRQHQSKLYKCLQAHTSQADWTPTRR